MQKRILTLVDETFRTRSGERALNSTLAWVLFQKSLLRGLSPNHTCLAYSNTRSKHNLKMRKRILKTLLAHI